MSLKKVVKALVSLPGITNNALCGSSCNDQLELASLSSNTLPSGNVEHELLDLSSNAFPARNVKHAVLDLSCNSLPESDYNEDHDSQELSYSSGTPPSSRGSFYDESSFSRGSPGRKKIKVEEKFFCVEDAFLAKDIKVSVEGVGQLKFPIREEAVKKLIGISQQAKFGKGKDTILDTTVRDTQMIPASKLDVQINPESLKQVLLRAVYEMNFGETCQLVPHLYNLLVYGPGQFFKMHQDTEKVENMVATLVIVLPSPHKGGDLIIRHNRMHHKFFGSGNPSIVKCIAFFSDCFHEVLKVEEGYRVALTYNLELQYQSVPKMLVLHEQVRQSVVSYFKKDIRAEKLIYLLDHEYTERNLKWDLLKGTDRTRAFALLAVAKKEGYYPMLALADDYKVMADEDEIVAETSLYFWVDESDSCTEVKIDVPEGEICWSTKTGDLFKPYETEETAYAGNEGGETSYWYKRAGVVLFASTWAAPCGYKTELNNLHKLTTEPGMQSYVLQKITENARGFFLTSYWSDDVIGLLLDIVLFVNDQVFTAQVLSKLDPKTVLELGNSDNKSLILRTLDVSMWRKIVDAWNSSYKRTLTLEMMMPFLSKCIYGDLCDHQVNIYFLNEAIELYIRKCSQSWSKEPTEIVKIGCDLIMMCYLKKVDDLKINQAAAAYLARTIKNFDDWKALQDGLTPEQVAFASQNMSFEEMIDGLLRTMHEKMARDISGKNKWSISQIVSLVRNPAFMDSTHMQQKIIDHLSSYPSLYSAKFVDDLFTGIRKALNTEQMNKYVMLSMKLIDAYLGKECYPANWCLPFTMSCTCEFCLKGNEFLASPYDFEHFFTTVEKNRKHICKSLRGVDPTLLKVEEIREGRPYKLRLIKLRKVAVRKDNFNQQLLLLKSMLLKAAPAELRGVHFGEPSAKLQKTCH